MAILVSHGKPIFKLTLGERSVRPLMSQVVTMLFILNKSQGPLEALGERPTRAPKKLSPSRAPKERSPTLRFTHVFAFRHKSGHIRAPIRSQRLRCLCSAIFVAIYLFTGTPAPGRELGNQKMRFLEPTLQMFDHSLGLFSCVPRRGGVENKLAMER